MVDLQCCISFKCMAKSFMYVCYISIKDIKTIVHYAILPNPFPPFKVSNHTTSPVSREQKLHNSAVFFSVMGLCIVRCIISLLLNTLKISKPKQKSITQTNKRSLKRMTFLFKCMLSHSACSLNLTPFFYLKLKV